MTTVLPDDDRVLVGSYAVLAGCDDRQRPETADGSPNVAGRDVAGVG